MENMSIEEIRAALEDRNLLEVSKRSGVSYSAIRKISDGDGDSVSMRTVKRLTEYLTKGLYNDKP